MQLYSKLCQAFDDYEIDELGLLHSIPDAKDLPLESQKYYPLVVVECKLGIELLTLSTLLKESHEHYISLDKENKELLEQVTRMMIILKPDNYTAMNRRKELIMSGHIHPKKELALIELIFTVPRHAKSSIAWYHRQWLLTTYADDLCVEIDKEFSLCSRATALYPRNYYAWTYRYWILSKYNSSQKIVQKEYDDTCTWIAVNISDFSGFQYLQQVMYLLSEINHVKHMDWLNDLIAKYPGHESLWCHRRFCSNQFHSLSDYNSTQHKFVSDIIENRFIDKSLSDSPDDMSKQVDLALKFGLWQTLLERKYHHPSDENNVKLYSKVAPIPHFLDRQGL